MTKTHATTERPPIANIGSRDAVESAIERAKGGSTIDWDDVQSESSVPTWDDTMRSRRTAAACPQRRAKIRR